MRRKAEDCDACDAIIGRRRRRRSSLSRTLAAMPAAAADASKKRSAQEILAAISVALLSFWAPDEENGIFLRLLSAALGVVGLLLASVGLEMVQDWWSRRQAPKANPFEVQTRRVTVPTAPPGGVFTAAREMATHLQVGRAHGARSRPRAHRST